MLSVAKVGVGHADYYVSQAATGVSPAGSGSPSTYYTDGGESPGRWVSSGSLGVTAGAPVSAEDLKAVLSGVDPLTGERVGMAVPAGDTFVDKMGIIRQRKPLGAFDCTFSLPKSVSTLWAISGPETRKQIEEAWGVAVSSVVDYLQEHSVSSRKREIVIDVDEETGKVTKTTGELIEVGVQGGATVARFDHFTSRSGDPQLHSHLLFAAKVLCDDGVWRNLDGMKVYKSAKAASMHGASILRAEISQRLGWSWDRIDDRLAADIAGSPSELVDAWSSRRRAVGKAAEKRIAEFEVSTGREPSITERLSIWDQAAVATRKSKKLLPLEGDPHERWVSEAVALGVDVGVVLDGLETALREERSLYDRPETVINSVNPTVDAATINHLTALSEVESSELSDYDIDALVHSVINAGPGCKRSLSNGPELVAQVASQLRDGVTGNLVNYRNKWWSPGLVAAEQSVAAWLTSRVRVDTELADSLDVEGLSEDQAVAAEAIVSSPTVGTILIGPAGAGKTTTLARVADAVGHSKIVAAAPTAVAAGTLGASIGTKSSTVASLNTGDNELPPGAWIILDEAGQIGTRDLAVLCSRAAEVNGRLVLVGDTAQQGSVSAGGMFDALASSETLTTTSLTQLWRFKDPAEAAATATIHRGKLSGLNYHEQRGRVADGSHSHAAGHAADWWEAHRHQSTVISVPSIDLMSSINTEIGERRAVAGETGEIVHGSVDSERAIRVGDIVATRKNNSKLVDQNGIPIRNGDRWTVNSANEHGDITMTHLERGTEIVIPRGYADRYIDLGYAITQTRVQSVTVDASLTVATGSTTRNALYVGLTRGSSENWLYVVTDQPSTDPETPPAYSTKDMVLYAVFNRRQKWQTASDITHPALPVGAAIEHLSEIAATEHDEKLPTSDRLNVEDLIAQRDTTGQWTRYKTRETQTADDIDEWLATIDETYVEEGLDLSEQEQIEMEIEMGIQLLEPDHDYQPDETPHPADHHYYDTYDDDYGDYAYDSEEWEHTDHQTPADDGAGSQWAGGTPLAGSIDPSIYVGLPRNTLNEVSETTRTAITSGVADNPWLTQLWVEYQKGDPQLRADLTPIIAVIADRPVQDRITETIGTSTDDLPESVTGWAAQVRTSVRTIRAERHRHTIEQLAQARRELVETVKPGCPVELVEQDQTRWAAAIDEWLDHGCGTSHLSNLWEQTLTQTLDPTTAPPEPGPVTETSPASLLPPLNCPTSDTFQRTLTERRPTEPLPDHPELDVLAATSDWYHDQLVNHPDAAAAREYLLSRGIDETQWEKWQLGWAPDQWTALTKHLTKTGVNLDDAEASGVVGNTNGRHWDFLRGRIVFPIKDAGNTTIAFAGRALQENADTAKYMNTRNTDWYNKSAALFGLDHAADTIAETGETVLVEGYTDAIACHAAGITNAVAACGTAFNIAHTETLNTAASPGLLTIALDADTAGQTAATAATKIVKQAGIHHRLAELPAGTDPAELDPDTLRTILKTAPPEPWAATPQLANTTSINRRHRKGYTAIDDADRDDPINRIIVAHEIGIAGDINTEPLLDQPAQTKPEPAIKPNRGSYPTR